MSTKNLSRTLVEGGKTTEWKVGRKKENKVARKRAKLFCANKLEDIKPFRSYGMYRQDSFADKTPVLRRFVRSAKSKATSYDEVQSYLIRKYGRKSLKGWHLLQHFEFDMAFHIKPGTMWMSGEQFAIFKLQMLSTAKQMYEANNFWGSQAL